MRKALIPMLASLALCGAAAGALMVTNASAEGTVRMPMMALVGSSALLAQSTSSAAPAPGTPSVAAPQRRDFCQDRYAREVGRMAYTETRLGLTDVQRPLFDRWRQVMLDAAQRGVSLCKQRVAQRGQNQAQADPVERMSREEASLKRRLADLDAERPVFTALYQALTPEQRQLLEPRSMMGGRSFRSRG